MEASVLAFVLAVILPNLVFPTMSVKKVNAEKKKEMMCTELKKECVSVALLQSDAEGINVLWRCGMD